MTRGKLKQVVGDELEKELLSMQLDLKYWDEGGTASHQYRELVQDIHRVERKLELLKKIK